VVGGAKPLKAYAAVGWLVFAEPYRYRPGCETRTASAGAATGLSEGRLEGRLEGEAAMLLLLERRFGALPARVRDRVSAADIAVLEAWSLRILDAERLDDVLP
jgi:hypothetical protein